MLPLTVCPATCELCGNWLPQHQVSFVILYTQNNHIDTCIFTSLLVQEMEFILHSGNYCQKTWN